jgi:hypothetical protein
MGMAVAGFRDAAGEQRVVLALAAQPVLAAILAAALYPLVEFGGRAALNQRPADSSDAMLAFALGVAVVAVGMTVFVAAPLVLWLRRRGPVTVRHALLSGLLLGNAPAAFVIVRIMLAESARTVGSVIGSEGWRGGMRAVAFGSFMGVTLALAFHRMCRSYLTAGDASPNDSNELEA